MRELHVVLVHGWTGSGPHHWQSWLAEQLRLQNVTVDFPELPNPERPTLDAWLPALRERLAAVPPTAELVVAAHSCGATLWLHHAASLSGRDRRAHRVLLVAPPGSVWTHPDVRGFHPAPLNARALRRAASITRMVAGHGDPYSSQAESRAMAAALDVELDVVPGGEHLNTDAGYGPWPSALEWVLGDRTELVEQARTYAG